MERTRLSKVVPSPSVSSNWFKRQKEGGSHGDDETRNRNEEYLKDYSILEKQGIFKDESVEREYLENLYTTTYTHLRGKISYFIVTVELIVLVASRIPSPDSIENYSLLLAYICSCFLIVLAWMSANIIQTVSKKRPISTLWLIICQSWLCLATLFVEAQNVSGNEGYFARVALVCGLGLIASYVLIVSLLPVSAPFYFFLVTFIISAVYVIFSFIFMELTALDMIGVFIPVVGTQALSYHVYEISTTRRRNWANFRIAGVKYPFSNKSGSRKRRWSILKNIPNSVVQKYAAILRNNPVYQSLHISSEKVSVQELIGRGATGEVYKGMYCDSMVALKCLSLDRVTENTIREFLIEIKTLINLRHPNIVQLMGVTLNEEGMYLGIIVELMEKGSLRSVLKNSKHLKLSWEDPKCKLAMDIVAGMEYLHENGFIHRDLKSDNVLVSSMFTCKISDFATSGQLAASLRTQVGTPFWRAPEMLRAEKYNEKADVYSFGILLLEMQLHCDPFDHLSSAQALEYTYKVAQEGHRLDIPEDTPPEIEQIICECWAQNPEERPSFMSVRRKLLKYYNRIQGKKEEISPSEIGKMMLDQIIISQNYEKIEVKEGQVILEFGEEGDEIYIILKGEVSVYLPDNENDFELVERLTDGNYFGEMGLIAYTTRMARCVATEDTTCVKFSRETFMEVFDDELYGLVSGEIIKRLNGNKQKHHSKRSLALTETVVKRVNSYSIQRQASKGRGGNTLT